MSETFLEFTWFDLLDITLLSILFYYLFLIIRGTKGVQLLKGLIIVFLATFLARLLGFRTLNWFLEKVLAFGALAILIIFQPEFRNALVRLGEGGFFSGKEGLSKEKIDQIIQAAFKLAKERHGALIALEVKVGLGDYLATGKTLDAEISKELLITLFNPGSLLHDGAVIISRNKISGAGCILPLSERPNFDPRLGTRHRAALGLSEQTDSLVLVVSEEKGSVGLARNGILYPDLSPERLSEIIGNTFGIIKKSEDEQKTDKKVDKE